MSDFSKVKGIVIPQGNVESITSNGVKLWGSETPIDYSEIKWSTSSWEEIAFMLQAHYLGKVNIADYWNVGESRTIPISNISASGSNAYGSWSTQGKEQSSCELGFVILGFNHDEFADSTNKSALTVGIRSTMPVKSPIASSYDGAYYRSNWNTFGWRDWCNYGFLGALPSELQPLVKEVKKEQLTNSSSVPSQKVIVNDKVFFLSSKEVFGSADEWVRTLEGSQYEFFKNESNRASGNMWWTKTPREYYTHNITVNADGSIGGRIWSDVNNCYIKVAFCL